MRVLAIRSGRDHDFENTKSTRPVQAAVYAARENKKHIRPEGNNCSCRNHKEVQNTVIPHPKMMKNEVPERPRSKLAPGGVRAASGALSGPVFVIFAPPSLFDPFWFQNGTQKDGVLWDLFLEPCWSLGGLSEPSWTAGSPQWAPKRSQNGSKMASQKEPWQICKTVLSPRRELT